MPFRTAVRICRAIGVWRLYYDPNSTPGFLVYSKKGPKQSFQGGRAQGQLIGRACRWKSFNVQELSVECSDLPGNREKSSEPSDAGTKQYHGEILAETEASYRKVSLI